MPKKAPIPGLETFKGEMWHTVSWPKDADLKGKRVGIIGTGSSAAQLIPKIYPDVASMTVYQRSPSHCVPRNDFEFSSFTKTIFSKFNWVMKIYRSFLWKFVSLESPPVRSSTSSTRLIGMKYVARVHDFPGLQERHMGSISGGQAQPQPPIQPNQGCKPSREAYVV